MNKEQREVLAALQAEVGEANKAKGFSEEYERLHAIASAGVSGTGWINENAARRVQEEAQANLRNHQIMALALIITEASEAIEELRNGRAIDETWYSCRVGGTTYAWTAGDEVPILALGYPAKPEGVPSELADIVIRVLDLSAKAGIDLSSMIQEKLGYNATREYKHGKTC